MKWARHIVFFLTLLVPLMAYGQSPETARKKLDEQKIPYRAEEFIGRAAQGETKIVELFLAAGMNPNVTEARFGRTALHVAAQEGRTDTVKLLLDKGANLNAKDTRDLTALTAAAFRGHAATVDVLLARDAQVNARSKDGGTALMTAAVGGHTDVVQALLAKGADVNAKNNIGVTALMAAAGEGHVPIVRALIEKGADTTAKDSRGLTALMMATTNGQSATAQVLKQVGAKETGNVAQKVPGEATRQRAKQGESSLEKTAEVSNKQLEIVGIVKNRDGAPVIGQVVYLGPVEGGRVSTVFKQEGGRTTGLLNPSAMTDDNGNFKISPDPGSMGKGQEFTLGILDCPKCFTLPKRRLMKDDSPLTFRLVTGSEKPMNVGKEMDLGVIILSW